MFDNLTEDERLFLEHITSGKDDAEKTREILETIDFVLTNYDADLIISPNVIVTLARCSSLAAKGNNRTELDESIYHDAIEYIFRWFYSLVSEAVRYDQNIWEEKIIHFSHLIVPNWLVEKHRKKEDS